MTAEINNFLSNPTWTGIAGIAAVLALVVVIFPPFFRTAKLKYGIMYGITAEYLPSSKEGKHLIFSLFFVKNLRFNYAHNISVHFDSYVFGCKLSALGTFNETPQYITTNDADGRTILNITQIARRCAIIISTSSSDRPSIVRITLDNGRAFPENYYAKIQSQLTGMIIKLTQFFLFILIVSVLASIISRWIHLLLLS